MTTKEKLLTPIDTISKVTAIEVKCIEFKGGLLDSTDGPPYTLFHADGTKLTQCHPIVNGEPVLGEWDPDWSVPISHVTAGTRLPSSFSGLMRQVIQCLYSRNEDVSFMTAAFKTHGICKGADTPSGRPYWVVEIATTGVYAKRLPFIDKREDKDEHALIDKAVAKKCYDETAIEYEGAMGPNDLSKKCCSVRNIRKDYVGDVNLNAEWLEQEALLAVNPIEIIDELDRIHKLMDGSDMDAVFDPYNFYSTSWAFNYSGSEAQIVGYRPYPAGSLTDSGQGHLTARWKITISETSQLVYYNPPSGGIGVKSEPTLAGSVDKVEENRLFYLPHDSVIRFKYSGTYNTYLQAYSSSTVFPNTQDAPLSVWYDGDTEKVVRYKRQPDVLISANDPDWSPEGDLVKVTSGFIVSGDTKSLPFSNNVHSSTYPAFYYVRKFYSNSAQPADYDAGFIGEKFSCCILDGQEREGCIILEWEYSGSYANTGTSWWHLGHYDYTNRLQVDEAGWVCKLHSYVWNGVDHIDTLTVVDRDLYITSTKRNKAYIYIGGDREDFDFNPGTTCVATGTGTGTCVRDGDFWYRFLFYLSASISDSATFKRGHDGKFMYLKQHYNSPYHVEEYVVRGGYDTSYGDIFIGKV